MKLVLFENSTTQRVTINTESGKESVLMSKEWRKSSKDDWILGKSIEIPYKELWNISRVLRILYDNFLNIYYGRPTPELNEELKNIIECEDEDGAKGNQGEQNTH